MEKERIEDLRKWLHTCVDSLVYHYNTGDKDCMYLQKKYISDLLANFN